MWAFIFLASDCKSKAKDKAVVKQELVKSGVCSLTQVG